MNPDDAALVRAREVAIDWLNRGYLPNGMFCDGFADRLAHVLRTYGDERERAVAPTHCNICMYDPCACVALDERAAEQRERDAEIILGLSESLLPQDSPLEQLSKRERACAFDRGAAALRAQEEKPT